MQLDPNDPRIPSRPLWGLAILALPLVGLVFVFLGYAGVFLLGLGGREASGQQVTLWYSGCAEAQPVVAARLADMGLAAEALSTQPLAAQPDRFGFSLTLPADPLASASIPSTLGAPGTLELSGGGQVLADQTDVRSASVRMDLLTQPSLLLVLDEDAQERVRAVVSQGAGELSLRVDQQPAATQSHDRALQPDGVELIPSREGLSERQRWVAVAGWAVTVDHPLPCTITLLAGPAAGAEAAAPAPPTR